MVKNVWETDVARFGIDILMTTTAIANNFNVCQTFLGAKIHSQKDSGVDLSLMFYQVLSSSFNLMEEYFNFWKEIRNVEEVPIFGFKFGVSFEPINVNIDSMIERNNN